MARLHLTGGLAMEGPEGTFRDADLPGQQGRVALAALAIEHRPMAHDELAEIVWSESPPAQWKSALAAVVSKVRALFTSIGLDGNAVLASSGGSYTFALPAGSWIDVEHAFRSLDRAEGALRHDRPAAATADATVASGILRRPLLAGVDGVWIERQRQRHDDALYRSLVTLAGAWNALGDHQLASTIAESAVELDPYRERAHRLLIEAECGCGDRGAALRAYERCERIFVDELGVRLSPATLQLAGAIRSADT